MGIPRITEVITTDELYFRVGSTKAGKATLVNITQRESDFPDNFWYDMYYGTATASILGVSVHSNAVAFVYYDLSEVE